MIWDFINSVIKIAGDVVHAVYSVLPQSPVYIPASTQTELAPVFAKLAWFFPVSGMISFLVLYIAAVFLLAGVLLIKQLVESALP